VALALLFAISACPAAFADCPNQPDPAVSCEVVTTPCNVDGRNQLMPGIPVAGQEGCSGNALFPLSVGAMQLFFNSHMSPLSPEVREDEGFGKGVTALHRLSEAGGTLWLRAPHGGLTQFIPAGDGQWQSVYRRLGDLSVIQRDGGAFKLLSADGSVINLSAQIRGHYFATEWVQPSGIKTLAVSYQGDLPNRITSSDGSFLTLGSSDGVRIDRIRDADGVEYRLVYDDTGYLIGYLDPANGQTLIFYTAAAADKERYPTQISNRFGQSVTYAYYTGGIIRAITDSSSAGTRFTNFLYSPDKVVAEYETPSGVRQHSTTMFAKIQTQEAFVVTTYKGDKSADNNPGVLLSEIVRRADGKIASIQSAFGHQVSFFYTSSSQCDEKLPQVSPVATCVRAHDGSEVRTQLGGADLFLSPVQVTKVAADGKVVSTTTMSWLKAGVLSSVEVKKDDKVLSTTNVVYEGGLPRAISSTSESSFTYDDSVVKDRLAAAVLPSGTQTTYQYDSLGRVIRSITNGNPTQYAFENFAEGVTKTTVSSLGITRTSTTDFWGENADVKIESSLQAAPAPAKITASSRAVVKKSGTSTETGSAVVISRNGGKLSYGGASTGDLLAQSIQSTNVSKIDVD
jgi:YD repeat-containing protein